MSAATLTQPFDQVAAFSNLWENIRQTRVLVKGARQAVPAPHHRAQAEKCYRRTVRSFRDHERILAALEAYRKQDRVKRGYVMDAGTWFGQWAEWEPEVTEKTTVEIMGEVDEAVQKAGAREFHRPHVEEFIREHGDPARSVSARALFNEWASSAGDGGVFAAFKCHPSHDFWQQWLELVNG